MKKFICTLALAALLAGCASVDYQAYEGKNNSYDGQGGTKVVEDGVEIWANGSPPRKFSMAGVATIQIGDGWGADKLIRQSVAKEVKARGGDAAVQMTSNTSFSGYVQNGFANCSSGNCFGTGVAIAAHKKTMQFAIVKYLD